MSTPKAYTRFMAAALLALAGAVLVAVVYVALAERMYDGSFHRRQLDTWVALAALVCLSGILYGGTVARRDVARRIPRALATPIIVYRQHAPDLSRSADLTVSDEVVPDAAQRIADEVTQGGPVDGTEAPIADAQSADTGAESRRVRSVGQPAEREALPVMRLPTPEVAPIFGATAAPPPLPSAAPSATLRPFGVATDIGQPFVTETPWPTSMPQTVEPTLVPSATPHCGEPDAIHLRVERLDTTLDRSGGDLVVRYRARIRNESDFPATMANIVVTALNHAAGSEQFGHATRPDVILSPGAVITLDGVVTLTKSPPPFGSTDVCLTAVGETCGRRPPYRVIRQCSTVRGF